MTDDPQQLQPLPGLELPDRSVSPLEASIRRTLASLDRDGFVHEVDAGKVQLALELAQVIDIKKRTGRASTVGMDARVLMEILNDFKEEASEVDHDLAAAMDSWREVLDHGAAQVRNSP